MTTTNQAEEKCDCGTKLKKFSESFDSEEEFNAYAKKLKVGEEIMIDGMEFKITEITEEDDN